MNESHFKEQYSRLTSVFDSKFLPKTYRGTMFKAVKRLSNEEMSAAVDLVIETFMPNTSCRFPLPSHIFQAARQWTQSNQSVPLPATEDEAFQQVEDRTDDILKALGGLPRSEYSRIRDQASREIDGTCPEWLYKISPALVAKAKEGRMITIYCRERNIPLPSEIRSEDERDGARIAGNDFGVGYCSRQ